MPVWPDCIAENRIVLVVETELRPSSIQGIGVFLRQPVRQAQLIWRFDSRIDRVYSDSELETLPAQTRDFIRTYSTWHDAMGLWVLCGDNGRHFNHSERPNTLSHGIAFGDDVAARDLAAGEELTSDYRTICDAVRLNPPAYMFQPSSPSASTMA